MRRTQISLPRERRGSILLIVLVIIVLLALGAYAFTEMSVAENEATAMYGRTVMARAFAESGIDVAANSLADPAQRLQVDPVLNRPDLFSAVLLRTADVARGRGRFSVIAGQELDQTGATMRNGLTDETGKLNLNQLLIMAANSNLSDDNTRNFLMQLPNMTNDVADAMLDWIDSDEIPRQYGCEAEYYQGLPQPYKPANGFLTSLDDLLLVRGVTPLLLYGEDLNRNGIMDAGEDVNGDGYFDRGWSRYLTIYSSERNLQQDGTPRININQQNLPQLFEQIQGLYGDTTAQFIIAYRMNGALSTTTTTGGKGSGGSGGSSGGSGGSSGGSSSSGTSSASSSSSSSSGGGGSGGSSGGSRGGGGSGGGSSSSSSTQTVQLGGIAVPSAAGSYHQISSIYSLVGAQVRVAVNGKQTTLTSPWSNNTSSMGQTLPDVLDKLTLVDDPFIQGRINVNSAPYEVLMGIPNMTQSLAQQIVGAQGLGGSNSASGSSQSQRATTAWLVAEGLVTSSKTMAQLDPYITAHGAVYRVQSIGYFDEGGPFVRLEAVIDGSVDPPRILNMRDLTELGRGFTRQQLGIP
jgi:type II secretory pathway component PulK